MVLSCLWRGALPYLLMLWMSQILGVISSGKIYFPIETLGGFRMGPFNITTICNDFYINAPVKPSIKYMPVYP